jgi:hypothetical protein
MENWKRGVLAASTTTAVIFLMKKRHSASVLAAGVSLAVLASEYPEVFRKIREDLPYYFERGTRVFDLASKVGERMAAQTRSRGRDLLDEFYT